MKKLTILIAMLMAISGCSIEVPEDQLTYYDAYPETPFTGSSAWYYENGQLESSGNWKDGKVHGLEEAYYKNGQLRFEGNWKDGKADGLHKSYYENGELEEIDNWKDGELID